MPATTGRHVQSEAHLELTRGAGAAAAAGIVLAGFAWGAVGTAAHARLTGAVKLGAETPVLRGRSSRCAALATRLVACEGPKQAEITAHVGSTSASRTNISDVANPRTGLGEAAWGSALMDSHV